MSYDNLVWAENIPNNLKSWVTDFFSAADEKGEESACKFSECFAEDGNMEGMTGLLPGRKGMLRIGTAGFHARGEVLAFSADKGPRTAIHGSRLRAWDAVETRKHILYKVYSLGQAPCEILILGKLESSLKNGKSFEMEFAAQAVFQTPVGDRPKAASYRIWAVSFAWTRHSRMG
jgi:hypothetical protein